MTEELKELYNHLCKICRNLPEKNYYIDDHNFYALKDEDENDDNLEYPYINFTYHEENEEFIYVYDWWGFTFQYIVDDAYFDVSYEFHCGGTSEDIHNLEEFKSFINKLKILLEDPKSSCVCNFEIFNI